MAKGEKIDAEVNFKAKGLKALRSQWLDFAGDLAEPMILLTAGATKAQAAWAGLKGVFLTRVLGPMGMVAGASTALLFTTNKLVSKWKEMGVVGAASMARMTLEFKPLLGNIELAQQRVEELYKFTASTPFQLKEVSKANKTLETLTQGALSTEDGMKLVGDSAVVAGVKFDETARHIGRMYDGLMSGRPVGEASMRLQELGLISGQTRNALESMQASGVEGAQIWAMVSKELAQNKGAMRDLSEELEGLQSTYADTVEVAKAGFGKGFMEGEKVAVKAQIAAWEKFTPVLDRVGRHVGSVTNRWEAFKAWMVQSVTSIPGFVSALKVLTAAFVLLNAAVVVAAGAALGRWIANLAVATAAQKAQIAAVAADTAVKGANTVVTRHLIVAQGQLAGAYTAVRSGAMLTAASHLKMSAAATLAAFKTSAFSATAGVLSIALRGTGLALKFVAVQLKAMLVSLVANPIMLAATAFLALGAALLVWSNNLEDSIKKMERYRAANDAMLKGLEAQRNAIKNMVDLRKHETEVLGKLTDAYREHSKARQEGDSEKAVEAHNKIIALEKELAAAKGVKRSELRMSAEDAAREESAYREAEAKQKADKAALLDRAGPDEKLRILEERLRKEQEKQKAAKADIAEGASTGDAVADVVGADMGEVSRLRKGISDLEAEAQVWRDKKSSGFYKAGLDRGNVDAQIAKRERLIALRHEELALLEARGGIGEQTKVALESESEVSRLEAKLALVGKIASATAALRKAEEGAKHAEPGHEAAAFSKAEAARTALSALQSLRGKHGGFANQRAIEEAELRLQRLKERRDKAASGSGVNEAQLALDKAKVARENEVARVKLDAEEAVAGLRMRGFEAEAKVLEFAREKLELAREQKRIGEAEYESQLKILGARRKALSERAQERGKDLVARLVERRLRRQSEDARRAGDHEQSKELRKQADAERDAQRRRELTKQAEKVTRDPARIQGYVDSVMAEEKAGREGDRKREEVERAAGRARAVAEGDGGLGAEVLRMQGRGREARRVEEARQRKLDEVRRGELQRKYRSDGFSADEADRLANRDVKTAQAGRALDMLRSEVGGSHVVASSLAKIAGGGGVSGKDPNTRILEQIRDLLKQAEDDGLSNIDLGVR